MFDIAWSELFLIAIVALIFIGPKELPHVLNNLGKAAAKLRRSADEFRRHFEDSMREAGYEDLHKNLQDFRSLNPANQLKSSIEKAINQDYTAHTAPASAEELPRTEPSANPGAGNAETAAAATLSEIAGLASAGAAEGTFPKPAAEERLTEGALQNAGEPATQKLVDQLSKDHPAPVA
ncbi:MAG: Sec-independent protein translocase protein TatB [Rhodomicrobium sp.]